ncbi:MAG: SIR2 family protein [Nitrososphaera sp.]|nr:SIR2 family protein [Nitrososphaera sp.]
MSTDIFRLPEPVKRAGRLGELVVFVGAGLSSLCESPLWDGFADSMIDELGGDDGLSFLEREQLKAIKDARRRASIAVDFANRTGKQIDFERILHPRPTPDGLEVYQLLAAMNPVFVTTNYDRWLDQIPSPPPTSPAAESTGESAVATPRSRNVYYRPEQFLLDALNEPGSVIHLHGSCTAPDSMVVSLQQYIAHYTNSYVTEFLKELFQTRTVLFIGYGLSELDLLEYIVKFSPKTDKNGTESKHFLLYAYRSTEATQLRFLINFFQDQCGIQLIPYCIDKRGYDTVIEVLRGWREQIDVRGPTFIDCQYQIDRAMADAPSKPRRAAIVHMIQNDDELAQYFFSKVTGLIWLEDLLAAGFYDPKLNPKPELTADKQYWNITIWPALQYLERVAEEATASGNSNATTHILGVLSAVTVHAREQGLDNTRTWWILAKTLAKLPTATISLETIDLVDVWLTSRFDATLTGHTLGTQLLPRLLESNDVRDHEKAARLLGLLTKLRQSKDA